MANTSESNSNFLQGLSDLWVRFFKDQDKLEAVYEATEILAGQAYLDLLFNVLNASVREALVFRKEYFKLLTVREDDIYIRAADGKHTYELTDERIKGFDFLYNRILGPTVVLDVDIDFIVDTSGDKDELVFENDPFDWDGLGNAIPGMAQRVVEVDGTEYREIALWIPDAQTDNFDLYLKFGYLINRFEPSSEAYRALLQGVMQYFVLGPTEKYLTSALNVILGLPVIRTDGEILQEVDTSDPEYVVVKTNKNDYQFMQGVALRSVVSNPAYWGSLTLNALDYLTDVVIVKDNVSDPTWWYDTVIPQKLLPDESHARRILSPRVYENRIDNPPGLVRIGDPGFIIGADDDGYVPTSGRTPLRHLFSYIVMERFLKHHIFTVEFDPEALRQEFIPFPRLDLDVHSIVVAGKSAYTYLHLEPGIEVDDEVFLSDTISIDIAVAKDDEIAVIDNMLRIGAKSWKIGEYFQYDITASPPTINRFDESVTPIGVPFQSGKTPLCIGGSEPSKRSTQIAVDSNGQFTNLGGGTSRVELPGTAANIFDSTDVGRWLKQVSENLIGEITEVENGKSILVSASFINTIGYTGSWELWETEYESKGGGCVDWPVQIRVY